MTVRGIRSAITQAKQDGNITEAEIDQLMIKARDGKGLSASERSELLKAASTFDDAGKQRLLRHLSAMGQKSATLRGRAMSLWEERISTRRAERGAHVASGAVWRSARMRLRSSASWPSAQAAAKSAGSPSE